jgi:hypothetical protein
VNSSHEHFVLFFQVLVYSSLPFNELEPVDECESKDELKEIQKRYNLSTLHEHGISRFGQKVGMGFGGSSNI